MDFKACSCGAHNIRHRETCWCCGKELKTPTMQIRPDGILQTPFLEHIETQSDNIVHPNHYSRWAMEPIEFIAINDLPWWLANVVKYTMRYDAKNGLEDLYKARSYLEMKIRQLEGVKRFWDKPVAEERKLNGK